jgi:carboxylesterase type B
MRCQSISKNAKKYQPNFLLGLFHKAILQSGTAFNPWAFCEADESKMLGKEICEQLECYNADSSLNLAKLKAIKDQQFVLEGLRLKKKRKLELELVPSLDAASNTPFLPSHPRMLEVADVPIMIGVTTHEGMFELHGETFFFRNA